MDKTLADLMGDEDAAAASEMIDALREELKKEAHEAVAAAKRLFESLDVEDQNSRESSGPRKKRQPGTAARIIGSSPAPRAARALS